ncbi:MAG: Stp1/IreP family PP2C-type Ser/Thr phosphatase [Clostridia bacterium]|nr:Stp1/IreP family PP2C-type Ser/Thr phosphatase [Clostridia bacterium]MBQ6859175.1 Stp1/IreP family PP2C-type Ser/Thr phosphatase [Clostridia bacterium]MBQ7052009.1 Stp1/IreP family PP2C-type Ser/Thr phosphatase [Clostridia bacterium]
MAATLRTHVGRIRRQNEDAAWLDEARGVFAIADGMGGHLAGEVASKMAIDAVMAATEGERTAGVSVLRAAAERAHEAILAHAEMHPECSGMGTTLSVMWRGGRYMYIAHVGDSRIYRLRGGKLEQITEDHSLVEELVRAKIITREEARTHPRRNIITRALGTPGENSADLLATDTQRGDLWLLCSDGLNSMISDREIERTMNAAGNLENMADALIAKALDAGGRDNVTLILYRDEEVSAWIQD